MHRKQVPPAWSTNSLPLSAVTVRGTASRPADPNADVAVIGPVGYIAWWLQGDAPASGAALHLGMGASRQANVRLPDRSMRTAHRREPHNPGRARRRSMSKTFPGAIQMGLTAHAPRHHLYAALISIIRSIRETDTLLQGQLPDPRDGTPSRLDAVICLRHRARARRAGS